MEIGALRLLIGQVYCREPEANALMRLGPGKPARKNLNAAEMKPILNV